MSQSSERAATTVRRIGAGHASKAERSAAVFALLRGDRAPGSGESPALATRPAAADLDLDQGSDYSAALVAASENLQRRLTERARLRQQAEERADRIAETLRVSPEAARRRAESGSIDQQAATKEALVRRVDRTALNAPADAFALARFTVELELEEPASRSPGFGPIERADLEVLACRALAEAAYRAGDLVEAERALQRARAAFLDGSLSPALGGDLARVEAEIRSDQSLFPEARKLAQQAVLLYRRAGERTSEARATISLALKWYYEGELGRALETTERGLALLDPEKDGRLRLAAEFNRVFWWNDAGRHAEARAALPRLAALAARDGGESDRLRLGWLEARVVANEGDLERAVVLYEGVLARSLELDVVYDSATVAFELAGHLLELGRAADVLPLAETVARVFATQGVAPEAAAALLLAADALRQGAAAHEALRLLRERESRRRSAPR